MVSVVAHIVIDHWQGTQEAPGCGNGCALHHLARLASSAAAKAGASVSICRETSVAVASKVRRGNMPACQLSNEQRLKEGGSR